MEMSLCERCTLLSFDDLAIGGQESVGEDGVVRLSFPDTVVEPRPPHSEEPSLSSSDPVDYNLVRLAWHLDDVWPDLPHLSRSSRLGCLFCNGLRNSLLENVPAEARRHEITDGLLTLTAYLSISKTEVEGILVEGKFNNVLRPYVDIKILFAIEACPGKSRGVMVLWFAGADTMAQDCKEWLGAEPARPTNYLATENIFKMRQLLRECVDTCHPDEPALFLPTRLIDVGLNSSRAPHLVLSSEIDRTNEASYAALSYCWGNENDAKLQFKTEQACLVDRKKSLESAEMTPVIKDAIGLTKAIGIPYLWVDALCIIQDDVADWLHEASQMHLIYRNAFVTFCGLNSTSCHETLLHRAPTARVPFRSTIRPDKMGYYLIRLQPLFGSFMNREKFQWDLSVSRWAHRGWVYQESELSRRLLLFGSLRMYFQCGRCKWSEGDDKLKPLHSSQLRIDVSIAKFKRGEISVRDLYSIWLGILHVYGNRLATRKKDRLLALSGLARIVGEALGDQYLAGIWRGDLLRGLDWLSRDDSTTYGLRNHLKNLRCREYVAPSWSWAACTICTTTCFPHDWHTTNYATVVDVDVETELSDPFSQTLSGSLWISGQVAPVPASLPQENQTNWSTRSQGLWEASWKYDMEEEEKDAAVQFWLDWLQSGEEEGLENLVMILLHQYHEVVEDADGKDPQKEQSSELLDRTSSPQLCALMLHPTENGGQYYRVGVVHGYGWAGCKQLRAWFDGGRVETVQIV